MREDLEEGEIEEGEIVEEKVPGDDKAECSSHFQHNYSRGRGSSLDLPQHSEAEQNGRHRPSSAKRRDLPHESGRYRDISSHTAEYTHRNERPSSASRPSSARWQTPSSKTGTSRTSVESSDSDGTFASAEEGETVDKAGLEEAKRAAEAAADLREQEEIEDLLSGIARQSKDVSVADAMKALDRVCRELRSALRKLYNLYKLLKKREGITGAEGSPVLAKAGASVFSGLRAVNAVANTGAGRNHDLTAAKDLVAAAWRDKHTLLTGGQRRELEGWVRSTKAFSSLMTGSKAEVPLKAMTTVAASKDAERTGESPSRKRRRKSIDRTDAQLPFRSAAARTNGEAHLRSDVLDAEALKAAAGGSAGLLSNTGPRQIAARDGSDSDMPISPVTPEDSPTHTSVEDVGQHARATRSFHAPSHPQPALSHPPSPKPSTPLPPPPPAPFPASAAGIGKPPLPSGELAALGYREAYGHSEHAATLHDDEPMDAIYRQSSIDVDRPDSGRESGGLTALSSAEVPLDADFEYEQIYNTSATAAPLLGEGGQISDALTRELRSGAIDLPNVHADAVELLLGSERLCLVLDLDHTLVNSTKFSEVEPALARHLEKRCQGEESAPPRDGRSLYRLDSIQMWTKLRPGVRQFLAQANEHFELWIHTNGNRAYANAIMQLLDPTGDLFQHRIIAQGAPSGGLEDGMDLSKRLMQGLEGRDVVALIIDDTSAVWNHHAANLLAVERYVYFPSSRRQFKLKGKSLVEVNRDECPERGMLMVTLEVLLRVHARVFAALGQPGALLPDGQVLYPNWDVRHHLEDERCQVLRGVKLLFSRIIPLDQPPHTHPLWRLASQFGATCTNSLDPDITHVVATAGGTEKVAWAHRHNKFVVTPAWLECSCTLWKRAHEDRFAVP